MDSSAATIGGITDDFDGDVRDVTTPDIGADEIFLAECTDAIGGTATVNGPSSFCGFGLPDIDNTGYSEGVGSTYQWMSSSLADEYPNAGTPLSMQNNPAQLVTDTVSTTTYFWLKVTCTSGIATAYSNMVTITVLPAPTATISPSGIVNVCLPTTSQLLTASTEISSPLFVWKKNGVIMDGATESSCNITESGSYAVEITDEVNLCSTLSEATIVTFDGIADAGTVMGTTPICIGIVVTYTTSGSPGGTWTSTNPSVASVDSVTGEVIALTPGTTAIVYTSSNICGDSDFDSETLTVKSIEVTNTNDSGEGSLRDIIACAGPGATITFSSSISGSTIILTGGQILINKNLSLAGPGPLSLAVSGNNASRIFHVLPGKTLTVQGMTLKNATAVTNGGAILLEGNLNIGGVVLRNNFENGVEKPLTIIAPGILQIIGIVDFMKN